MKTTRSLFIVIFTFLALTASAYAQSPREQLNQMVQQLQQTPNDNALREKIIQLATTLKPLPAIPEQAREPFVMGATVLKRAGDPAGAAKAVDLFTQALNIAPWFADAYYNRAVAREIAGQFEPAIDDLKLYLEFKLTDNERRQAQDKIYALKADAQLASTKKAEEVKAAAAKAAADTPQAREAALLQKVEGARFVARNTPENLGLKPGTMAWDDILEIRGRTLHITVRVHYITSGSVYGHRQPGEYVVDRISYRDGAFTQTVNNGTTTYRIRPDGQALIRQYNNAEYKFEIPRN